MAIGRRSFLTLLGLGGAAAPVALPAFGKAVAQQQLSRSALAGGLGAIGGEKYYGGSDTPDFAKPGRSLKNKLVEEFLGHLVTDQKEAEEHRQRFHERAMENYQLPSWSPTFRQYNIRKEYDARCHAARSIREQIQEKMKTFVGYDDYYNDQCEATNSPAIRGY